MGWSSSITVFLSSTQHVSDHPPPFPSPSSLSDNSFVSEWLVVGVQQGLTISRVMWCGPAASQCSVSCLPQGLCLTTPLPSAPLPSFPFSCPSSLSDNSFVSEWLVVGVQQGFAVSYLTWCGAAATPPLPVCLSHIIHTGLKNFFQQSLPSFVPLVGMGGSSASLPLTYHSHRP